MRLYCVLRSQSAVSLGGSTLRSSGAESQAHAPNEITWKQDLVTCAALYAAVPGLYKTEEKTEDATEFRQSLTDNDIQ